MILGSSGSLRPSSRTEPYTNFRDTTHITDSERWRRVAISNSASAAPPFPEISTACFMNSGQPAPSKARVYLPFPLPNINAPTTRRNQYRLTNNHISWSADQHLRPRGNLRRHYQPARSVFSRGNRIAVRDSDQGRCR